MVSLVTIALWKWFLNVEIQDSITELPLACNQAEETDKSCVISRHRPHDGVLILLGWALHPIVV